MKRIIQVTCVALLLACGCFTAPETCLAQDPTRERVEFARDVQPILAKHCQPCHGAKRQKGGLRLDSRVALLEGGDNGPAVVPGKSGESRFVKLIASGDEDERMPLGKDPLSEREIVLLRRWIDQGAVWSDDSAKDGVRSDHWAFRPPRRPEPPAVERAACVRNPIDRFVLARLGAEGLEPSPQADRWTLVRRLSLDLIGLPPTRAEAEAFVHSTDPDAYERLVERLLASPHYGERWARLWLDLARYADTNGYEKDRPRSIWAYRDWVIDAYNRDMPFDRFTIEQIAGDMLPNATLDQKIATGFHRNTMFNEEGGVEVEQFRFESIVDRVNTTGTVWLGMTVGCAQCHTHKYDPLTQKEYYELFAFLNNADEPRLELPDPAIERRRRELSEEIARAETELAKHWPEAKEGVAGPGLPEKLSGWMREKRKLASRWRPLDAVRLAALKGTTLDRLEDGSILASGDAPNNDVYTLELRTDLKLVTALKLEVLPHPSLPLGGPGRAPITVGNLLHEGDFLLSEIHVAVTSGDADASPESLTLGNATESYSKSGCSAALALDDNLDTGWALGDTTRREQHAVFELSRPLIVREDTRLVVELHQMYIHGMTLGRFRLSATSDALPVAASGVPAAVEAALLRPTSERSDGERAMIEREFLLTAPELAEARARIDKRRREMPRFETTLVLEERAPPHARVTHRRHRGEYLKPREAVEPGVPAILHPLPEGAPRNRLTFARWLVDPRNPLVARVVMNRQWQAFFGRGIVRTTEDFGTQSDAPTHPQLLDWLATEFVRRKWSIKEMHRLIVTSATYRQDSRVPPDLLERDPQNLLLARGPRFRVDAETVRDVVLAATGLLTRKVGGPSVFPPQPEGVTGLSYGALSWTTDTGPNRYRRGMYTFRKRTSPYAMFGTFDAPSGETCVVRRGRSNTPLQALTALNDLGFIEAARSLALRELTEGPRAAARLTDIFIRFLTRPPEREEIEAVADFYESQLARLRRGELRAADIVGAKEAPGRATAEDIDLDEWAAWTAVVRAVMNFDETITKE